MLSGISPVGESLTRHSLSGLLHDRQAQENLPDFHQTALPGRASHKKLATCNAQWCGTFNCPLVVIAE